MMFGYDEDGEEFFRNYSLYRIKTEIIKDFNRKKIAEYFNYILDRL